MAFTIPNAQDAAFEIQAQPDKVDLDILVLGHQGTGVRSGCEVTAQGTPDMTVAVASGTIAVAGVEASVTAGNVTITAADATHARFDLVVADNTGAKSAVAGSPGPVPVFPAIPANSVVMAAVYIPAADTAIAPDQIVDKRVIVQAAAGDLTAHLNDASDSHDASAISVTATGSISSTDVQAALAEIDTDLTNHTGDTSDAHDASAISFAPAGTIAATDVQAAIEEVASEAGGGGGGGAIELIEAVELGSDAASVTFSSIPQTYKHLRLIVGAHRTAASIIDMFCRFNGDTAANYQWQVIFGATAAETASGGGGMDNQLAFGHVGPHITTDWGNSHVEATIFDYASALKHALSGTWFAYDGSTSIAGILGGMHNVAAAITSVTLFPSANSFQAGSKFYLYGISG